MYENKKAPGLIRFVKEVFLEQRYIVRGGRGGFCPKLILITNE